MTPTPEIDAGSNVSTPRAQAATPTQIAPHPRAQDIVPRGGSSVVQGPGQIPARSGSSQAAHIQLGLPSAAAAPHRNHRQAHLEHLTQCARQMGPALPALRDTLEQEGHAGNVLAVANILHDAPAMALQCLLLDQELSEHTRAAILGELSTRQAGQRVLVRASVPDLQQIAATAGHVSWVEIAGNEMQRRTQVDTLWEQHGAMLRRPQVDLDPELGRLSDAELLQLFHAPAGEIELDRRAAAYKVLQGRTQQRNAVFLSWGPPARHPAQVAYVQANATYLRGLVEYLASEACLDAGDDVRRVLSAQSGEVLEFLDGHAATPYWVKATIRIELDHRHGIWSEMMRKPEPELQDIVMTEHGPRQELAFKELQRRAEVPQLMSQAEAILSQYSVPPDPRMAELGDADVAAMISAPAGQIVMEQRSRAYRELARRENERDQAFFARLPEGDLGPVPQNADEQSYVRCLRKLADQLNAAPGAEGPLVRDLPPQILEVLVRHPDVSASARQVMRQTLPSRRLP